MNTVVIVISRLTATREFSISNPVQKSILRVGGWDISIRSISITMTCIRHVLYSLNLLAQLISVKESLGGYISEDTELPSIWPEIAAKDRSYHLLYQLNRFNSNEVSATLFGLSVSLINGLFLNLNLRS